MSCLSPFLFNTGHGAEGRRGHSHGWTTGRSPESDICPVLTCTRVALLPREQEALRVVRDAIVNLEMDYYSSLYMELSLNAILKASTHATIAVLWATISGGILLVVTWKDLHGSGLLYNHPPSPGWICLTGEISWAKMSPTEDIFGAPSSQGWFPFQESHLGLLGLWNHSLSALLNNLKAVALPKHIWGRGKTSLPCACGTGLLTVV